MRNETYQKMATSAEAFAEIPLYQFLRGCFFIYQADWKEWINPWGDSLKFQKKGALPKLILNPNPDLEEIQIMDPKFFRHPSEFIYDCSKIWSPFSNFFFCLDNKIIRAHDGKRCYDPCVHGIKPILEGLNK